MSGIRFLPRDASAEMVLDVLVEELPGRHFEHAEMITNGWDNQVALVDGEWIFRFPKNAQYRFDTEMSLLHALRGKFNVPIPDPQFVGQRTRFMGYIKVPGRIAEDTGLQALDAVQVKALAEDIARFFLQMHSAMPAEAALALGHGTLDAKGTLTKYSALLDRTADPIAWGVAQDALHLAELADWDAPPRLVFHDLHPWNFTLSDLPIRR